MTAPDVTLPDGWLPPVNEGEPPREPVLPLAPVEPLPGEDIPAPPSPDEDPAAPMSEEP